MPSGLALDSRRGFLYEAAAGSVRIFDADSLDLLAVAPAPAPGGAVAYDPVTDQIYFLHEGRLSAAPASALVPEASGPLDTLPPAVPVAAISPLAGTAAGDRLGPPHAGRRLLRLQPDRRLTADQWRWRADLGGTGRRPAAALPLRDRHCRLSSLRPRPHSLRRHRGVGSVPFP